MRTAATRPKSARVTRSPRQAAMGGAMLSANVREQDVPDRPEVLLAWIAAKFSAQYDEATHK